METVADKYVVECTPDGEYYAYLCNHEQCFAYRWNWRRSAGKPGNRAEEFYKWIQFLFYMEDIAWYYIEKTHIVSKLPIFSHFSKAISVGRRNGFLLLVSSPVETSYSFDSHTLCNIHSLLLYSVKKTWSMKERPYYRTIVVSDIHLGTTIRK